jgi:maltose/moltooligosaccharide transporter
VGDTRAVPTVVRISFYMGAVAFMSAVLWTIATTKEYPPADMDAFRRTKAEKTGLSANVREILTAIREMPETMRRLGPVQFCTWMGLFCMWLYFPVAVAHNVFGAEDTRSPLYQAGVEWGGNCFAVYSAVCFIFSFALPGLARRLGRKHTHSLCLLMGALGLMSVVVIHNKWLLLLTMVGVGIAWASTLSMPYAVLAASIPPARTGVYMRDRRH